jgi:3'-phosphoadenosine 5'-phosphosulfate sulfotransferase (PAPS reductase)/FAD synthetase
VTNRRSKSSAGPSQQANGRAIVSTNFRPYEAVILHLCVQVQPDMPVLWVDHGYNRPATYQHAEELKQSAQAEFQAVSCQKFPPRIATRFMAGFRPPMTKPV